MIETGYMRHNVVPPVLDVNLFAPY